MPEITAQVATVYRVPSSGRRFLTLKAACRKEANAQMVKKYGYEFDNPYEIFHDEKLLRIRSRLERALQSRFLRT